MRRLPRRFTKGTIQDQTAQGKAAENNAFVKPWHELAPDLQQSNRAQADDIRGKLQAR